MTVKFSVEAEGLGVQAEQAGGDGVEGAGPGARCAELASCGVPRRIRSDAARRAGHFGGGAAGEGQQQDSGRVDAGVDEVGDAVGEGVGFAGAGAGDDEQRGLERGGGGGALLGVEVVEVGRFHAFFVWWVLGVDCNRRRKEMKWKSERRT